MFSMNMKKFSKVLDPYRILAFVILSILLTFVITVFIHQTQEKTNLQSARILEVLELEDDQGLIYQNLLVSLEGYETRIQVQVPLNLPEVKSLEKGDSIYLQEIGTDETGLQYRYASTDKTLEFIVVLVGFGLFLLVVIGLKPLYHLLPAVCFLVFIIAGVFNVSPEIRIVFLTIIGLMAIVSLVTILWFFKDLLLTVLTTVVVVFTVIFVILLHILLVNYINSSEVLHFQEIFSRDYLVYDFSQAKLLVMMIVTFGLIMNQVLNLTSALLEYLKTHNNPSRKNLIKFCVQEIQKDAGKLLNLVFFIALGLNFLGLVSEDFSLFNFVWNNSFFLGVMIDGVVAAVSLIVGGYVYGLAVSLYYDWKLPQKD